MLRRVIFWLVLVPITIGVWAQVLSRPGPAPKADAITMAPKAPEVQRKSTSAVMAAPAGGTPIHPRATYRATRCTALPGPKTDGKSGAGRSGSSELYGATRRTCAV